MYVYYDILANLFPDLVICSKTRTIGTCTLFKTSKGIACWVISRHKCNGSYKFLRAINGRESVSTYLH